MIETTYDTETDLSSVNSILGSIGQAPITTLFREDGNVRTVSVVLRDGADNPAANTVGQSRDLYCTSIGGIGTGLIITMTVTQVDPDLQFRYVVKQAGKNYRVNDTATFNSNAYSMFDITVTSLNPAVTYLNPEVAFVHQLLMESNRDVQNEGWHFNTEHCFPMTPVLNEDNNQYEIVFPANILRLDVSYNDVWRTTDVVKREGKLYDKMHHTFDWKSTKPINCDVVWRLQYEDLPSVFKRYITIRASVRAATQMVTNKELAVMLQQQEAFARAACMEYECNQGDSTFFGTPDGSVYRPYQPYRTLAR